MEALRQDSRTPTTSSRSTRNQIRALDDLSDVELDRQIRAGWDVWCELLDDLLSTGGMLPSRELAGRVVAFFEDDYWRAEDARIEALRRQMVGTPGSTMPRSGPIEGDRMTADGYERLRRRAPFVGA